jgi:hypothetical protein
VIYPKFSNIFSCILKEIYTQEICVQENMMIILVYQFWVLNSYFSYNTFHFPFKEVVYILFFGISKLLFWSGCVARDQPRPLFIPKFPWRAPILSLQEVIKPYCYWSNIDSIKHDDKFFPSTSWDSNPTAKISQHWRSIWRYWAGANSKNNNLRSSSKSYIVSFH